MSRIATLTAVLTMLVAPAAFAGPADLRSPDTQNAGTPAVTKVDLRSPDSVVAFTKPAATIDLRSPDAVVAVTPSTPSPHVASTNDGGSLSPWAFIAIIAAALAACAGLAVMLRRHLDVGRPVGV